MATIPVAVGDYESRTSFPVKLVIAALIALVSLVSYYRKRSFNPITQETQHVAITPKQEVSLGLAALPRMEAQYGGESRDPEGTARVRQVGEEVVARSDAKKSGYPFQFHLLGDTKTINAFALPGGQVFITEALFRRLETEGQLAGVLGHEVGHVVARHGAEHIAKQELFQGLTGAAIVASYDPHDPNSRHKAAFVALVGNLVTMKFGRDDELESDALGVRFMLSAGYDPHAMVGVMKILEKAGGGRQPEFFSTHPSPENRIERIEEAIRKVAPGGVPKGLRP